MGIKLGRSSVGLREVKRVCGHCERILGGDRQKGRHVAEGGGRGMDV
jgi:hypothetical protein